MAGKFGLSIRRKSSKENTNIHKHSVSFLINSIIEQADIILEILDTRFIEKTRNLEIEKKAKELGKQIVYILNKADLTDINFIKKNLELENLKPYIFFSCKDRKGVGTLREIIKIESKKLKKEAVNIGVIGYPNTGKSSIINILKGKSSAGTSPLPGFTRGLQKIKLSSGIYLIDTPGIIPETENSAVSKQDLVKHLEIGVKNWDKVKNPDMIVHKLMKLYPKLLENHYKINANGDSEILIEQLGRKLRYLKKGNCVDDNRTAKQILRDWQGGKIKI